MCLLNWWNNSNVFLYTNLITWIVFSFVLSLPLKFVFYLFWFISYVHANGDGEYTPMVGCKTCRTDGQTHFRSRPKKNIITCFGSCLKKKQHRRNIYDLKPKGLLEGAMFGENLLIYFTNAVRAFLNSEYAATGFDRLRDAGAVPSMPQLDLIGWGMQERSMTRWLHLRVASMTSGISRTYRDLCNQIYQKECMINKVYIMEEEIHPARAWWSRPLYFLNWELRLEIVTDYWSRMVR